MWAGRLRNGGWESGGTFAEKAVGGAFVGRGGEEGTAVFVGAFDYGFCCGEAGVDSRVIPPQPLIKLLHKLLHSHVLNTDNMLSTCLQENLRCKIISHDNQT